MKKVEEIEIFARDMYSDLSIKVVYTKYIPIGVIGLVITCNMAIVRIIKNN